MANIFSYESLIPKKFVQKGTQTEEGQYIITVNNLFFYINVESGGVVIKQILFVETLKPGKYVRWKKESEKRISKIWEKCIKEKPRK